MGRPAKPLKLVTNHLSKEKKEARLEHESSFITGLELTPSSEVKADLIALKEFNRVKEIYSAMGRDDDLVSNIISTHCLLVSECVYIIEQLKIINKDIKDVRLSYEIGEKSIEDYLGETETLQGMYDGHDKRLMAKRKLLLDMSKENLMTLASCIRSIPKKEVAKECTDPVAKFMASRKVL